MCVSANKAMPASNAMPASKAGAMRAQRGATLIEVAIALAVFGVLGLLASHAWSGFAEQRERQRAQAEGEQARQTLRAFALREGRLPCPDLSGDGREGDSAGQCPAAAQLGWLPRASLGMAAQSVGRRELYGVYRSAGADLVQSGALGAALRQVQRAPISTAQPFFTGDGGALGAENCDSNQVAHPAFVVVAPVQARGAHGNGFDGVHGGMPGNGSVCFAAPSRRPDGRYDDVVTVESAPLLLGWLEAGGY